MLPTFNLHKIFHTELITFLPTKFHMPMYSGFSVTATYQNIRQLLHCYQLLTATWLGFLKPGVKLRTFKKITIIY